MLKQVAIKIMARLIKSQVSRWSSNPIQTQKEQLSYLVKNASKTSFGQIHTFSKIKNYNDFKNHVPVRDYEELREYFDKIKEGKNNILWPGKPLYLAVTSGTTSGSKYIPITKQSLPNHLNGAKTALLMYVAETGKVDFVNGKFIFIQGSPVLSRISGILTGRLSGISAHHIPFYMKKNMLPSWRTNIIEEWEEKIESIVNETVEENMTIISGIPSWLQMYFEKIIDKTNKKISDTFPNFNLLIYGGVNFAPYKKKFRELFGKDVDSIELFPASEGFFAFQDSQEKKDLLLILNAGIFYEFIDAEEFRNNNMQRVPLWDVKKDKNYVMIISSSAGLWGYNTGDTVRFTSLRPYKIYVTGRIKQSLSAFGEHVIVKEVEQSIEKAISKTGIIVKEFTVAPRFKSKVSPASHEWFIEFDEIQIDVKEFANQIDQELQRQNKYYKDLIVGKIIDKPVIRKITKDGFKKYMNSIGKLGGQNKIPKISNDRKIADQLKNLNLIKQS
tara:strand:- start:1762 stop:3264 length:1503 start_codon:yes stop_codon:yes gene_type:complete